MSLKQFFKSASFKCIVTLLCILLICGIFLTVAYGFLEVTEQDRFDRAIAKIYGRDVKTEEVDLSEQTTAMTYSSVENLYLVKDDGNYLVKVTGKGGFGGTVTCWVVIETNDDGTAVSGVGTVTIDTAAGESYIGNIKSSNLAQFSVDYTDGIVYEYGYKNSGPVQGDMYIYTGASYSFRAISNAVNGAVEFVKAYLSGAVIENPYADYVYYDFIDMESVKVERSGDVLTYEITTAGYGNAQAFTVKIEIDGNYTIQSYEILTNGSTYGWEANMPSDVKDGSLFCGKDLSYFTAIYGEDMLYATNSGNVDVTTGATASNSNFLCHYAGAFAIANYDVYLLSAGESNTDTAAQGGNE